ncbi:helix-turn-helix domain-containing protein [Geodermatophilus sp. URMC 60]
MQVSPRLAGHLAIAVHDYRKRCAVTGTPAPLTQLDQLFQTLRWVNQGQPGSPIDPAPNVADAAPVAPRMLTVEQTAAVLAVSISTVKRLIARGELPAVTVGVGNSRVRTADVDRYVAGLAPRSTREDRETAA